MAKRAKAKDSHGGYRPGAGRKPKPVASTAVVSAAVAAEPKNAFNDVRMAIEVINASKAMARSRDRTPEMNPFRLPEFPPAALPPKKLQMAMDDSLSWANTQWQAGVFPGGYATEGMLFLGYPYLAELAQRPEYRLLSEITATEMTRKWIKFRGTGNDAKNKADRIKELTDEFERLEVRDRFKTLAIQDGLFGRSHLYFDFGAELDLSSGSRGDPELATPIGDGRDKISRSKVKKGSLKRLQTVEALYAYPTTYNAQNPLREDWYNPQIWWVMGKEIHCSRLPVFIGRPVPDLLKPSYAFGGLSMSQMAKPYVDIWLTTRQSVGELIKSFSVMVLMTDVQTILQPGSSAGLMTRVAMFNALRDNQGTFVVNKSTEDFKNVSASMAGLHELQAQAQEHMCSVGRIPLVKFTGISPSGLNASSEGELRTFYDSIHANQESFFRPQLNRVVNFAMLSLWGEVDPEITYDFDPLWALSEKEESDVRKADTESAVSLIDAGVLHPEEERKRIAEDPDSMYPGLDVEDVPDLRAEEIAGLEPVGGRPQPVLEEEDEDGSGEGGGGEGGGGPSPKPPRPKVRSAAAEDAAIPFLASDNAEFKEADHPRDKGGKFGSGGGGGASALQKAAGSSDPKGGASGEGSLPQVVRKEANATTLYQAPQKSAQQIVDEFPGAPEAIKNTIARLKQATPTDALVSEGGFKNPDGTYTPERAAVHSQIIDHVLSDEAVLRAMPAPGQKPTFTMLGGRGGSGKGWFTKQDKGPVDGTKTLVIDTDEVKKLLPGFDGWNAAMYHEESSDVMEAIIQQGRALGINIALDGTMKSEVAATKAVMFHEAGYDIEGYYMYCSPEEAARRALGRYSKGGTFSGRFVPPEVILSNTHNEAIFDKLSIIMKRWAVYDNNAPDPEKKGPKLVSKNYE